MKNQYIKMFFTQTIQFIILLVVFHNSTNQPWFVNKLRDTIVLLISYVVFMVIPLFGWIFRPMNISIKQENKLGKGAGSTQILLEKNEIKTPQNQRTINLTIEITRRGSIWWKFLMCLLSKKEVRVYLEASPKELMLQGVDFVRLNEVDILQTGFSVNLNQIVTDLNGKTGTFTISKSYPYFVMDHPDIHIPHNLSAIIQPSLRTNGVSSRLTSLFIRFSSENHIVTVFKR